MEVLLLTSRSNTPTKVHYKQYLSGYSSYAKETVIACLSKYKEKKANVVAVLSDCIDASVDTVSKINEIIG